VREGDEGGRKTGSEWKESEKVKALMDGKQERAPLGPRLFLSAFHFNCGLSTVVPASLHACRSGAHVSQQVLTARSYIYIHVFASYFQLGAECTFW